jgi:hypothetical protein
MKICIKTFFVLAFLFFWNGVYGQDWLDPIIKAVNKLNKLAEKGVNRYEESQLYELRKSIQVKQGKLDTLLRVRGEVEGVLYNVRSFNDGFRDLESILELESGDIAWLLMKYSNIDYQPFAYIPNTKATRKLRGKMGSLFQGGQNARQVYYGLRRVDRATGGLGSIISDGMYADEKGAMAEENLTISEEKEAAIALEEAGAIYDLEAYNRKLQDIDHYTKKYQELHKVIASKNEQMTVAERIKTNLRANEMLERTVNGRLEAQLILKKVLSQEGAPEQRKIEKEVRQLEEREKIISALAGNY